MERKEGILAQGSFFPVSYSGDFLIERDCEIQSSTQPNSPPDVVFHANCELRARTDTVR